ncbi:hypothetical protein PG1805B_1099 [Bifidobacterium pseudolongum subsp. globosum]|nr:hypothetical protein PG1805B_1099 [Bifidobacterium pseudolongum subsp. globosum]
MNKVLIRCTNRLSCTRRLSCTKRTIGLGEPESSEPQRSNGRLVVRIRRAFGSGEPSAAYSLYTVRSNLVGCGVHRMRTPVSPEDEYMDSKDRATKKRSPGRTQSSERYTAIPPLGFMLGTTSEIKHAETLIPSTFTRYPGPSPEFVTTRTSGNWTPADLAQAATPRTGLKSNALDASVHTLTVQSASGRFLWVLQNVRHVSVTLMNVKTKVMTGCAFPAKDHPCMNHENIPLPSLRAVTLHNGNGTSVGEPSGGFLLHRPTPHIQQSPCARGQGGAR